MARRTQLFQKVPWTGGINSAVDAGVLPSNDLVQADNVVFATSGSRLKREGFSYLDTDVPTVTHRSSSGTTRTLVFSSSVSPASPADQILVVGEKIKVVSAGNANYNTTEGIISSISTTTATNDTIAYTFSGAASLAEGSTADTAATVSKNYDVIGIHDLWYYDSSNNVKTQEVVTVTSQGLIFKYDVNGRRTQIAKSGSGATSLAVTPVATCDLKTFNNKLIVTLGGLGNTPKYYDPNVADEWKDLPNAPDGQYMQEHLGRLWMDDKTTLDRLHFSETFDETVWLGVGDSGALDLSIGDGDPVGVSAIFSPFRGRLIVAKDQRVYQIVGEAPETFTVVPLAGGIGAVSHKSAVAIEMSDIYYLSRRGVHSVTTTDQFGDFAGKFLSRKIQPTFNSWTGSKLKLAQGTYISTLNSAAWTVAEDGQTKPSSIWLFNPTIPNEDSEMGVWYRWPNLYAQSITTCLLSDKVRLICGDDEGRILLGQNSLYTDFDDQSVTYRIKSGTIYPDGNPQSIKAFKKLSLLFKPRGRYNFSVYFKVDNFPPQALSFDQNIQGDELGSEFTLGTSILGSSLVLAPYSKDVVGHGRGFSLEVFQTGLDAQVEIYGFIVEYEVGDIADEVSQGE